jgi:WW domain-containing oxidoreductase
MSIYGLLQHPGPNGFGYNTTAEEITRGLDLSGKTYLLTGCNSGPGAETLRVLTARGAIVIAAARTWKKPGMLVAAKRTTPSPSPGRVARDEGIQG